MILASALISKFWQAITEKWGYIYGAKHEMWTAAKQAAYTARYSDDPKRKQSCLYGEKWIGHWVTDCSGLFAWAFEQLGGKIAHGSNSIWNSYGTSKGKLSKGKRTDGKPLLPGTAVLTGDDNGHGHIGLYVGDGKVIEAMGTSSGVVTSLITNKKWTYWEELKGVKYDEGTEPTPTPEPTPVKRPTLRKGSKGDAVRELQTMLIEKGYNCGSKGADGIFGNDTVAAVKAFQKASGLTTDGIVGQKTWEALDAAKPAPKVLYTVTIPQLSESEADELLTLYPGSTKTKEG